MKRREKKRGKNEIKYPKCDMCVPSGRKALLHAARHFKAVSRASGYEGAVKDLLFAINATDLRLTPPLFDSEYLID